GGRDGLTLAEAFLRAKKPGTGVVVTGPLMPPESRASLRLLAAQHPRTHVLEFVTNPCPLLERADRVVAMGGYNTICETWRTASRRWWFPEPSRGPSSSSVRPALPRLGWWTCFILPTCPQRRSPRGWRRRSSAP